jgi:hypothetical protein
LLDRFQAENSSAIKESIIGKSLSSLMRNPTSKTLNPRRTVKAQQECDRENSEGGVSVSVKLPPIITTAFEMLLLKGFFAFLLFFWLHPLTKTLNRTESGARFPP